MAGTEGMNSSNSNTAYSLGVLIKKELKERGTSQKTFAEALGVRTSHLSEFISGKRPIPSSLFPQIASFVGLPIKEIMEAQLEQQLNNKRSKILSDDDIKSEEILRLYDNIISIKSLMKNVNTKPNSPSEMLTLLLNYYALPDPKLLESEFCYLEERCFRRSSKNGLDKRMICTWVVKARNEVTRNTIAGKYDELKNKELAEKLSIVFHNNKDTVTQVRSLLDAYGFGFAIVPKEEHASIDGYSFFYKEHPYIVVTQRYNRIDNFAFTVLHELGHIVLGHTNDEETMLSLEETPHDFEFINNKEAEADKFATDTLISEATWCLTPKVSLNPHVIQKKFTEWAREKNLNEWIVLGRVSHETGMYRFKSNKSRTIN